MPTNRLDPTFLGNLSSNLFFSNGIGGFDTEDDYLINLSSIGNINISVVAEYALDFQISLIRDINNNGVIDTNYIFLSPQEILAVASTSSYITQPWYGSHSNNIASLTVANLNPGNYYVRVSTSASNFSAYQISLSSLNPSNLIAEEINWGNLSSFGGGTQGSLDRNNVSDFYRFNLTTTADINIHNIGYTETFFRLLRDSNNNRLIDAGEVIITSPSSPSFSRSINLSNQGAGTYFLQIYLNELSSNSYDLRASTADPSNFLDIEDSLGSASLSTTISKTGAINNTDTSDFYTFTIDNYSKNINLSLTGLAADADLRLIRDSNKNRVVDPGEIVATSALGGSRPDAINLYNQPIDTYYVQVYQYSTSATNYTLRLSSTIPNNLMTEEDTLGVFVGQTSRTGFVGKNDTSDIYRLTLTASRQISARLSGMTGDADLRLIRDINNNNLVDLLGEYVVGSATGGTRDETFSQLVSPGEYFLQVTSYSANETNYNLSINVI